MNRFLLLALTAGLFSPIAASADDFKVRDTCGRLARREITGKEASKRLKLKKTLSNGEKIPVEAKYPIAPRNKVKAIRFGTIPPMISDLAKRIIFIDEGGLFLLV